uniref:Uncharacterized protein n=1 Tax=Chromera velia CCMP2878 TaxID=1169474 RepID=A0A0G4IEX5_9ALVE|eukprot:Cvel_13808.t1-p1 / transcript=Cvel_13808.t1 / gene=Cvel_13808 / organism=Chromera_velia_CCMP2878 / gene_product=hypothetical protein / transcript_product=hypothetical protein / location=Cvel_scaffold958:16536-17919(-) / protein_length=103 / sequence_SO=supercontig / SO=protein_coding / is_pseudo=false
MKLAAIITTILIVHSNALNKHRMLQYHSSSQGMDLSGNTPKSPQTKKSLLQKKETESQEERGECYQPNFLWDNNLNCDQYSGSKASCEQAAGCEWNFLGKGVW